MSFLSRLRPTAVAAHSRRTYSSFFSSGSGGGRYFTSAKLPKPVVSSTSSNANKRTSTTTNASPSPAPASAETQDKPEGGQQLKSANGSPTTGVVNDSSSSTIPSDKKKPVEQTLSSPRILVAPTPSIFDIDAGPEPHYHPSITSEEFKLLQFFASHRPLLLIEHPSLVFDDPLPWAATEFALGLGPPQEPPRTEVEIKAVGAPPAPPNEKIHDAGEADAEAARQLSRALTMSHLGGVVQWGETLHRLGLKEGVQEVGMKERMEQEWEEVMMDSVKRKRRKKMKKHKLKKRRRATRAQRLKYGR